MKRMRTQSGLSLLEMMTASVVVAVSLLGTTAAVISGATLSQEVTRMHAAQRAATTVMEDVRGTDFAQLVDTFDETKHTICGEEYGIDDAVATVSVTQVDNGSTSQLVYEVTITVSFEGAAGGQTFPIVTYVADRVAGSSLSSTVGSDPEPESDPDPQTDPQPDPDPVDDGGK